MSIDNYVNGMSEGSQRRGSVKDKVYKRPVSILVVIYAQDTKRVLMLQRRDDPDFWQSVTGSVEEGETAPKLMRLIDMLEDCDDVQEVYHNGEISDEVAATL